MLFYRHIGKGSMDKVDSNDNNTLDDWDMHHPAKKIKVKYIPPHTS
jgi:hypothetical protein